NQTLVGLVLLHDEHLRNPPRKQGYYFLWRLMIDAAQQGKGYGTQAVELVIRHVASRPFAKRLLSSYHPGKDGPAGFYRQFGFRPTGNMIGDEIEIEIPIAQKLRQHQHPSLFGPENQNAVRPTLTTGPWQ